MGYLVVAHVTKAAPDLARLQTLPANLGWVLYRDEAAGAYFIDLFEAGRQPEWPFTALPPTKQVTSDLPPGLEALTKVYRALEELGRADSFRRGFVNINRMISSALQMPVCSLCADDDGLDLTCVSNGGSLQRLRFESDDLEVTYDAGKVVIQPHGSDEMDEDELADVAHLHDPAGGIHVEERDEDLSTQLHNVATAEVARFLGVQNAPLGLGTFDGMETPPTQMASRTQNPGSAGSAQKTWWKFWK